MSVQSRISTTTPTYHHPRHARHAPTGAWLAGKLARVQSAPLPVQLQAEIERVVGESLEGLRIGFDELTGDLGAQALAYGDLVVLHPRHRDLRRPEAMALLLHEVTHVLQQRRGAHLGLATPGELLEDEALEREARASERWAPAILVDWEIRRIAGCEPAPPAAATRATRPVVQLSQGLEFELGGVAIGRAKANRKGIRRKSLSYGFKLFKTRNSPHGLADDIPRLYAEVDNRNYSMPELVTEPIMAREAIASPAFALMLRDAEFIAVKLKEFIDDQPESKRKRSLADFIAFYNQQVIAANADTPSPDDGFPVVRMLRPSLPNPGDVYIGIRESRNWMQENVDHHDGDEEWAIEVMVHHNASAPIERIGYMDFCDIAERTFINSYYGAKPVHRRLWRLSIGAAHCLVDKYFGGAQHRRKMRKLVGLFSVICYTISTMCKTRRFMGIKSIYKNKFALLPRNYASDLVAHALSSNAQQALGEVVADAQSRAALFSDIAAATGSFLDEYYGQEFRVPNEHGKMEEYTFNPQAYLDATFAGLQQIDDNTFRFDPVADDAERALSSIFANVAPMARNEDDFDEKPENAHVIRNVVFEQRFAGKFPYLGLAQVVAPLTDNGIPLWDFAFTMDQLYREWKLDSDENREILDTTYQVPETWIDEFRRERGWR